MFFSFILFFFYGSKVKEVSRPDKEAKRYRLEKDQKIGLLTVFETTKLPNKLTSVSAPRRAALVSCLYKTHVSYAIDIYNNNVYETSTFSHIKALQ